MKTLAEYQAERREHWSRHASESRQRHRAPSGIACPKCGDEMRIDLTVTLTSNPPQRNANCEGCGHHEYVLA